MGRDLPAIAEAFWRDAGGRSVPLREAAEAALPVAVIERPALTADSVARRLRREGAGLARVPVGDGPLRGCVYASRGHGQLLVRAGEGPFTLAHEIAHFLLHYHLPRRQAVALAGPAVVAALDGDRPATPAERLTGALALIDVGPHVWLVGAEGEAGAEREADELAAHLLGMPRRRVEPDPLLAWARQVLIGGRDG